MKFIAYFIVYSFIGWVLESIYKSVLQKKFVNSGFLIGPFCPIYGFGAIIMLLALNFLKEKPIILFIAAFFVLSVWEYMVSLMLEKMFKTKYWDYSHIKFNINGRVCLKNSIYWGILGVLFICCIHPLIENYISLIPNSLLNYIIVILGIAMTVDLFVSVKVIVNFETMVSKINELGENIKDKIKELKDLTAKNKTKVISIEKENIENILQELKIKQTKLKTRIYKQANRLKKAFPSMQSDTITKFLAQKIETNKQKEKLKK